MILELANHYGWAYYQKFKTSQFSPATYCRSRTPQDQWRRELKERFEESLWW